MTLLERLQSHKGGLIKLKTELFWYGGRRWDENPGCACLLLDAAATAATAAARTTTTVVPTRADIDGSGSRTATAYLLIDGSPHWVWIAAEDVEFL